MAPSRRPQAPPPDLLKARIGRVGRHSDLDFSRKALQASLVADTGLSLHDDRFQPRHALVGETELHNVDPRRRRSQLTGTKSRMVSPVSLAIASCRALWAITPCWLTQTLRNRVRQYPATSCKPLLFRTNEQGEAPIMIL